MDELLKQMRHALEQAESKGFQRGYRAGLKAVAQEVTKLQDGAVQETATVAEPAHKHTIGCCRMGPLGRAVTDCGK